MHEYDDNFRSAVYMYNVVIMLFCVAMSTSSLCCSLGDCLESTKLLTLIQSRCRMWVKLCLLIHMHIGMDSYTKLKYL